MKPMTSTMTSTSTTVTRRLAQVLRLIDRQVARASLRLRRERPALLGFLFHSVFESAEELAAQVIDPYQPTLLSELASFIDHFLAHGYRFVRPADLLGELDEGAFHALLTFDDGYANNLRILPVLRERGVPATFFVSSNHVAHQKAFWWDAVYRARMRAGADLQAIHAEVELLKQRPTAARERYVLEEFGPRALDPQAETDRPLSAAELKELAAEPLATIGNHTADHAILPFCADAEVEAQIAGCQDYLAQLTGTTPDIIAYPDGACDPRVAAIARSQGLRLGAVVDFRKNHLPLGESAAMRIARCFVASPAILEEALAIRSDFRPGSFLRQLAATGGYAG